MVLRRESFEVGGKDLGPVIIISPDAAEGFFRCTGERDLRSFARGLRDLGVLVAEPERGRLTYRVRLENDERVAMYVIRNRPGERVPRRRRRTRRVELV